MPVAFTVPLIVRLHDKDKSISSITVQLKFMEVMDVFRLLIGRFNVTFGETVSGAVVL